MPKARGDATMIIRRTAVSAFALGLLLLGAGTTFAKEPQAPLQLPITGLVAGGGTFTGTLSLQKFVARDGQVMAIGMVTGSATSATGTPLGTTVVGPIVFPVHVGPGTPIGGTANPGAAVTPQATCEILHIDIGAVNLNVLGLQVMTQPVVLDISGDTAGVLGNLVCTILDTVNNVIRLVGLLNQLLALLTGLLGAVLPG
jgi:hypothetical protein